jgi:hypothetical protein
MIKLNVNRLGLNFFTSTELALMCFGRFGSEVRYINIGENNKLYYTKDDVYH